VDSAPAWYQERQQYDLLVHEEIKLVRTYSQIVGASPPNGT
jgi:hypothetical protein